MTEKSNIRLRYSSVDGCTKEQSFTSLADAQRFAHHWIGPHPEIGRTYAISGDGIGKIEAAGVTLAALFPEPECREQAI
jgi:hypothetical protein